MPVEIRALVWDEANEGHLAKHGVSIREVAQMLSNPHVIVRNRKQRSTRHLLIGSTHGGRILEAQRQVLARALSPVDEG